MRNRIREPIYTSSLFTVIIVWCFQNAHCACFSPSTRHEPINQCPSRRFNYPISTSFTPRIPILAQCKQRSFSFSNFGSAQTALHARTSRHATFLHSQINACAWGSNSPSFFLLRLRLEATTPIPPHWSIPTLLNHDNSSQLLEAWHEPFCAMDGTTSPRWGSGCKPVTE